MAQAPFGPRRGIVGSVRRVTGLLVVLLLLAGCSQESAAPDQPVEQQPTLRISGSGSGLPILEKLAETYKGERQDLRFRFEQGTNSSGAIRGVAEHTLDLAIVYRKLKPEEAAGLVYRPFARDAVAFAVHQPSSIRGITTRQVQAIYAGKLKRWSQLGGADVPIVTLDRDPDEGTRQLVIEGIMAGRPVHRNAVVLEKADEMVQALRNTPNAIGYNPYGMLRLHNEPIIRVLALDGIVPTPQTIATQRYPWRLTFALVHRADAPPPVRRFVDFVQGPSAQKVLRTYGYASITG